ncbi:hypothetical protein HMPREF9554_02242 [Treponema phagedenis F0421]|nr:hypothetical protein HMPREF9554_02242 [Treponema phagedenis F0421]
MVPSRNDVLKQSCLQSFKTRRFGSAYKALKLAGLVLPWTAKLRTARRRLIPRRNDVLKQNTLQSFKTRKFGFAMDGKTKPELFFIDFVYRCPV